MPITCVLADDHPPILDSLARYLGTREIDVVATATGGESAAAAVLSHRPCVCVADLRMPRLDGLGLADRLHGSAPETAVLLYSGVADAALVSDALDAGASGFALKDAPLDDVARRSAPSPAGASTSIPSWPQPLPALPFAGHGARPRAARDDEARRTHARARRRSRSPCVKR